MQWPRFNYPGGNSPRVSNHNAQISPRVSSWDSVDANDISNMQRLAPPLEPIRTPGTQHRELPPHPGRVSAGEWWSESRLHQTRHVMEDETTPLLPRDGRPETPSQASERAELVYHAPPMQQRRMSGFDSSEVMVARTMCDLLPREAMMMPQNEPPGLLSCDEPPRQTPCDERPGMMTHVERPRSMSQVGQQRLSYVRQPGVLPNNGQRGERQTMPQHNSAHLLQSPRLHSRPVPIQMEEVQTDINKYTMMEPLTLSGKDVLQPLEITEPVPQESHPRHHSRHIVSSSQQSQTRARPDNFSGQRYADIMDSRGPVQYIDKPEQDGPKTTGTPSSNSHFPGSSPNYGLTNRATLSRSGLHDIKQHYWHNPNYVRPEAWSERCPDVTDCCMDAAHGYNPHQGKRYIPHQQPPQYPPWRQTHHNEHPVPPSTRVGHYRENPVPPSTWLGQQQMPTQVSADTPDNHQSRDAANKRQHYGENGQCPIGVPLVPWAKREHQNVYNGPNRQKRPSVYEGKSSFRDYLVQFEMVSALNKWDRVTQAMELATSLSGPATEVLTDLDLQSRLNYDELVRALLTRFEPDNQAEVFRSQLKGRTRKRSEPLPELCAEVKKLVRKAYPDAPSSIKDVFAKDCFIDALNSAELEWSVRQSKPLSLDDALRLALEYEAFEQGRQRRQGVGTVVRSQTESSTKLQQQPMSVPPEAESTQTDLVAQLADFMNKQMGNQRRRRQSDRRLGDRKPVTPSCYSCGESHRIAECPTRATNQCAYCSKGGHLEQVCWKKLKDQEIKETQTVAPHNSPSGNGQ